MMDGHGKSDRPDVPAKSPNKGGPQKPRSYGGPYTGTKAETPETAKGAPTAPTVGADPIAEGMEGKGLAKGNLRQQNAPRTPSREGAPSALERVRQAARRDRKLKFTALLHHVYNLETLRTAYLNLIHYAFDLWVQSWRQKHAHGDVIVVRFADDIVVGFQSKPDAVRFWAELVERLREFRLELHPEKTRLLEFGPFAAKNRKQRGEGKPETFNFLGFTHICGKKRSNGRFTVLRQTIRKRVEAKLSAVKAELKRRMHDPIPKVGEWLRSVVGGHTRYYGVPMNGPALALFRFRVGRLWHRALSRRSQNGRVLWDRMRRLIDRWLPPARVCHPYPLRRLDVIT